MAANWMPMPQLLLWWVISEAVVRPAMLPMTRSPSSWICSQPMMPFRIGDISSGCSSISTCSLEFTTMRSQFSMAASSSSRRLSNQSGPIMETTCVPGSSRSPSNTGSPELVAVTTMSES